MSIGSITALVETLVAAGATPELILAAVKTAEAQKDAALEQSREKARNRVQKWRDKQDETSRNVTKRPVAITKRLTRGEDSSSNQEITGKEEKKVASPSARPSRGSRIPEDFRPDIEAAVAEGVPRLEAERQARSFCDYWRSKPGSGGLKLDWPATWRVWYRRNIPAVSKPLPTAPPRKPRTVAELAIHRLETGQTTHEPPDEPDRRLGQSFGSGQAQGPGVLELVAIAANGHR